MAKNEDQTTPDQDDEPSADGDARTFTRRSLISVIQSKWPTLSRREAGDLLETIIDEIVLALARDGHVKLQGFGAFIVREKAARPGRNPRTGQPAEVAPRKSVVFKASPVLKSKVDKET